MKLKNKKTNFTSLKTQMTINFLCAGIIPLLIFTLISSIIIRNSMYKSQVMSMKQISSLITSHLDAWGDDNLILVEDMANSEIIKTNNIDSIKLELKSKQGQNIHIDNIMYIDTEGNILADSLGSKNGSIHNEDYFNEITKGFTYTSNIFIDKENSFPFIVFSSPVKSDNKIIGYIVNKVKTTDIKENIGDIFYSLDGEIFTFSNDGLITYHNKSSDLINKNILNSSDTMSTACKQAIEGNFNSTKYSLNGINGLAVYNYIPSLNWGTVITMPNSELYEGFNKILLYSMAVIIVIVLVTLIASFYILKRIANPIAKIVELTQSVSDGNLTIKCNLDKPKEIVDIGNHLNKMVDSLKTLVLNIYDKNTELNGAATLLDEMASAAEESSKDISTAMEEIARTSVAQASKTDTVLISVKNLDEKMSELTTRLAETNKALEISNTALLKGNNGTNHLKNSTLAQSKLIEEAVSQVNDLSTFVSNIDEVIETIRDIAEQTSLLSLNASIEASRAGESGKGFAVVAEEVGKLANESKITTEKTASILNNIKLKADSTTKIMNSINDSMILQSTTVDNTISAFDEIIESDNKISDNIKSFSSLIDYIKDFSDELLSLIESLASSSEESAAVAEEVTASSEEQIALVEKVKESSKNILNTVTELKSNIERFNIERDLEE